MGKPKTAPKQDAIAVNEISVELSVALGGGTTARVTVKGDVDESATTAEAATALKAEADKAAAALRG